MQAHAGVRPATACASSPQRAFISASLASRLRLGEPAALGLGERRLGRLLHAERARDHDERDAADDVVERTDDRAVEAEGRLGHHVDEDLFVIYRWRV